MIFSCHERNSFSIEGLDMCKEIKKIRSQSLRRLLHLYCVFHKQEELPSKRELVARVRKNFNVSRAAAYDYANAILFLLSHPSSMKAKES